MGVVVSGCEMEWKMHTSNGAFTLDVKDSSIKSINTKVVV